MKINFNPVNYQYCSFGRISAIAMIDKIGKENFPSSAIYENVNALGRRKDITLYQIHSDYYSKLLDCKSLDEAKELYPEFYYVKDAKDIDSKDMTKAMKALVKKNNNLSLDLLKKYYALSEIPNDITTESYYNYSRKTIERMFSILNIKRYDPIYLKYLTQSKPEHAQKQAQNLRNYNKEHPEAAQKHALYMKELFSNEEKRKEHSELIRNISSDDAFVQKQRERTYDYLKEHPELAITKSIAHSLHPEISEKRSEIASNYPYLGIVLRHLEEGKELKKHERGHLWAYNQEVKEKCPDGQKIIGEEQKIWLEKYRSGEITLEELEEIAQKLKKA